MIKGARPQHLSLRDGGVRETRRRRRLCRGRPDSLFGASSTTQPESSLSSVTRKTATTGDVQLGKHPPETPQPTEITQYFFLHEPPVTAILARTGKSRPEENKTPSNTQMHTHRKGGLSQVIPGVPDMVPVSSRRSQNARERIAQHSGCNTPHSRNPGRRVARRDCSRGMRC